MEFLELRIGKGVYQNIIINRVFITKIAFKIYDLYDIALWTKSNIMTQFKATRARFRH